MKKVEGCAHLYFKNGKPIKLVTHLSDLPKNGVIHLKGSKIYSYQEFQKSHPNDIEEVEAGGKGIIISDY